MRGSRASSTARRFPRRSSSSRPGCSSGARGSAGSTLGPTERAGPRPRRGDADAGAVRRRLADRCVGRCAASTRLPLAAARDRAAADDPGRLGGGCRAVRFVQPGGGADPRRDPRADGCRAGAGGRHRSAASLAHPAGAERRVGAQRRHLRAAAVHRARDRRGRDRIGKRTHGALVLVVEAIGYGVLFGAIAGLAGAPRRRAWRDATA